MPPQTGLFHLWVEFYKYVAPTALVPFANGALQIGHTMVPKTELKNKRWSLVPQAVPGRDGNEVDVTASRSE